MDVHRTGIVLRPTNSRVVMRPFAPTSEHRYEKIIARVSSLTFRSGLVDAGNGIVMDEPTRFVTAPDLVPNALYDRHLFGLKLTELGIDGTLVSQVMAALDDWFTLGDLELAIRNVLRDN